MMKDFRKEFILKPGISARVQPSKPFGALRKALALAALMLPLASTSWAATETVLHVYVDTLSNENGGPISGLAMDASGNLYGTTFGVGACSVGCGSVFKLTRQSSGEFTYQAIYKFLGLGIDGENPYGAPILDSAGNIYGTTTAGANGGVVYKLSPQANGTYKETILHFFGGFGSNDGTQPYSTLVFDKAGNLYGTTNQGGGGAGGTFCLNGCGTVFKLAPNADGTWTESVIHSFTGDAGSTDGQNPHGGVVFDSAGNLWGTTQTGGNMEACLQFLDPSGCGTVFELTPQSNGEWLESTLFEFAGESTGFNPWDGLVIDKSGNLYGMVTNGGGGNGAVFKLTPQSGGGVTETIIHAFTVCGTTCTDGANPENGITIDASGNLYGTTDLGGGGGGIPQGHGVVFKLTPHPNGTWTEKILHRFTGGIDGAFPLDDHVVVDSAGNVFGTAFNGGQTGLCPAGCGVVFEIKP
jgi:uncharacterized repeat protein (TIGR03803 family)